MSQELYEEFHKNTKMATRIAKDNDFGLNHHLQIYKNFITNDDSILDVGCGAAPISLYFASKGMNVKGVDLSQRAGHPPSQLRTLHGSLFDIKCSNDACSWVQRENYDDPFCAALAPASEDPPEGEQLPLLNPYHRIKHVTEEDLPKCPSCNQGLQRPGVVWFGEMLDQEMMMEIQNCKQVQHYFTSSRQNTLTHVRKKMPTPF